MGAACSDVHDRIRTRFSVVPAPGGSRPLAVRAVARAVGRCPARQGRHQPGGRRAAAWGSAIRRPGACRPSRRVRPLSHEQGARRVLPGRSGLAGATLQAAAPDRPAQRGPGAQWFARGTFSGRDRRRALGQRPTRTAGHADPQPVLCRLCRGRGGGQLRAGLSAGDRRDRLPARPRCAAGRTAGAHRRLLHRLARQSAGRGRGPRLSATHGRHGAALWVPAVQRRMLLGNLFQRRRRRGCWRRRGPISPT